MLARILDPLAPERSLRRGLALLGVLGATGIVLELALLRHWKGPSQLIAWFAAALLITAVVGAVRLRSGQALRIVRGLALAVVLLGAVGMVIHVHENMEAAPLDRDWSATWDTTPLPVQVLLAATDSVGPAPSLAPGALTFVALTVLLSTVGAGVQQRQ